MDQQWQAVFHPRQQGFGRKQRQTLRGKLNIGRLIYVTLQPHLIETTVQPPVAYHTSLARFWLAVHVASCASTGAASARRGPWTPRTAKPPVDCGGVCVVVRAELGDEIPLFRHDEHVVAGNDRWQQHY